MARYEYETSPKKIEEPRKKTKKEAKQKKIKIVKEVPRQEVKVSKEQRKKQIKMTVWIAIIFLALLTISYRNSQINIKFNEIQNQKKELAALEKENEQTEINIENNLNLSNIEKEAKERLGMEKLTNKQTVYVTLPKKDYIESASEKVVIEEEEESWFKKILDLIWNR